MHLEASGFLQKVFVLSRPSTLHYCGLSQTVKHLFVDVFDRSRIARKDTFGADFPLWIFQPCAHSLAIVDCLLFTQELQQLAWSSILGQIQRLNQWHKTWPIFGCHLQRSVLSSQIWSDSGQPLFLPIRKDQYHINCQNISLFPVKFTDSFNVKSLPGEPI